MSKRGNRKKSGQQGIPLEGSELFRAIQTLPRVVCPREVTEEIRRLTVQQRPTRDKGRVVGLKWDLPFRIGIGMALTGMVLMWILRPGQTHRHRHPPAISTEWRVEQTQKELLWSLAYASELLQRSEKKALTEVIVDEFPRTWRHVLMKTLSLIQGDGT